MNSLLIITYLIYIILYEGMIFGGSLYLIVKYDWSKWWLVLTVLLACSCITPSGWYGLINGLPNN